MATHRVGSSWSLPPKRWWTVPSGAITSTENVRSKSKGKRFRSTSRMSVTQTRTYWSARRRNSGGGFPNWESTNSLQSPHGGHRNTARSGFPLASAFSAALPR